jgi:dipeptidyl aminopeptidase/acylaminoacyl peptidase
VAVFSLGTRELKVLAEDGFSPAYAAGHVLYHQGTSILALPFDAESLAVRGSAFPVLSGIGTRISYQTQMFAVAREGTLVYLPQSLTVMRGALIWVNRRGTETPAVEIETPIDVPRLSPDEKRVAFRVPAPNCDVWVHDLARGATTRITFEGDNHGVVWTPDGRRLGFARVGVASPEFLSTAADGAGSVERLGPASGMNVWPICWAPNGRFLLTQSVGKETGMDIDHLPLEGERTARPLVKTPFDEGEAVISPDGRFVAYISNETGRSEVYVQPYPSMDTRLQVSTGGGAEPVWSRAGKELFFRQGRKMLAVPIRTSPALATDRPQVLFEGNYLDGPGVANYDVTADGQRFLMVRGRTSGRGGEVDVVLNWFEELRAAGSAGKRP